MKQKTLLLDLINKSLRNEKFDMDELEIMEIAKADKKAAGLGHLNNTKGQVSIPLSFKTEADEWLKQRNNARDIGTHQYLIGTIQDYIINPITEKSVFIQAGALFMPKQIEDVKVPSFSGILASWVDDETEPESDGDEITISGTSFAPKRLYICLDVPRSLLVQGGIEAEMWLRDNITAALAAKVDATMGGIAASGTNKPQGMGYAITTGMDTKQNAIVPTYSDIVALEEAVDGLNVPIENYAFITNPAGRRILRKIYKDETAGGEPVFKDGKINDYPAHISNLVSSQAGADGLGNLLLYGNWKDLAILQFGAYDIIADPFTLKKQGKIQLNINAYFDFKGLRGSAPTSATEQTQDNDYAISFSSLAIK